MHFKKFTQLKKLLRILKGRVVGGAVRNFLLNTSSNKELDIATPYRPEVAYKLAQNAGFNTIPLRLDHGTFLAVYKSEKYEVTTLRKDISSIQNRWAKVVFTKSWRQDSYRRDFTINALSFKTINPIKIADYINGVQDISNADERIIEDYLRILRLFRFWANYAKPNQAAFDAVIKYKNGLKSISKERIIQEFYSLCQAKNFLDPLKFIYKHDIYPISEPVEILKKLSPLSRLCLILNLEKMPVLKKWQKWQKQILIQPQTLEDIIRIIHLYGKEFALDYTALYLPEYYLTISQINEIPKIPIKPTDLPLEPGILMGIQYKELVTWWQKQYPFPSFEDCKKWHHNRY